MMIALLVMASGGDYCAAKTNKTTQKAKTSQQAKTKSGKASQPAKKAPAKKGTAKGATKGKTSQGKGTRKAPESRSELQRQQKEAQKEIAATRQKIQQNEKEVSRNVKELGVLEGDIATTKNEVALSTRKVNALATQISGLQGKIAADEQELGRLRAEYLKAIKKMRIRRKGNSELAYLFACSSLSEARRRMRYLKEFSDWRKEQSEKIEARIKTLNANKAELARDKQMQDQELRKQVASQRQLEGQYKEKDALVVELRANGAALKDHLSKKQAEANTLNNRVAALIAAEQRAAEERRRAEERRAQEAAEAERRRQEARAQAQPSETQQPKAETSPKEAESGETVAEVPKKANKPGKSKTQVKKEDKGQSNSGNYAEARKRRPRKDKQGEPTPQPKREQAKPAAPAAGKTPAAGSNFASMKGSLPRPVSGLFQVTSQFGRHSLPDLPDVMYDNPGIDVRVNAGVTAAAVYAGKVSGVYMIPGFSTVVIVSHGDYYTVYGNLSGASVKVGDVVKQGQGVGSVATDEDDPKYGMLHFEVWKNREKLNPQSWIR